MSNWAPALHRYAFAADDRRSLPLASDASVRVALVGVSPIQPDIDFSAFVAIIWRLPRSAS
jgi:hypothetical protein